MTESRHAIKELLNSAVFAGSECRDDQALELLREAMANAKMTYGAEEAGAAIISIIIELNQDIQAKFLQLWTALDEEKGVK